MQKELQVFHIMGAIFYGKLPKLIAFLKRTGDGYQAKKSKILTKSEIDRFLSSANDKEFGKCLLCGTLRFFDKILVTYVFWPENHESEEGTFTFLLKDNKGDSKAHVPSLKIYRRARAAAQASVGLILWIAGACRTDELTKIPRIFVVTEWEICLNCFENTCPFVLPTSSISAFFCTTKQENLHLKLPDVACYTGHRLRRSSATLLADAGVDITTIKRHAGWKSTTVAEGYVENSIENKTKIANQVLVGTTTSAITKLL
ncbi:hypothetical protein NQ317_011007 [Molorchus minor]|uniref:Tyr recombinase domain-containing protein n=1 Tax=Molorchus minor TaxID=1323400 RepID=A0ABQ9IPN4_9CUCU|nr:hypothetical protein NQ317_011007 [Molorchus minor]